MSSEEEVVARTARPVTPADVCDAMRAVGVSVGGTVVVHASLSRLGWVVGGAQGVVAGILDAVGPDGTIVMPAQTGISDPSTWQHPPVPQSWWPIIRETWPAFDPHVTPRRGMGAIMECFARLDGVVHSGHPALGFVARGPQAALMHPHALEDGLGDGSPLGRMYEAGARIVLIGVGHESNTSLHLAEHRADWPGKRWRTEGAPLTVAGERRWIEYPTLDLDQEDFPALAEAFEAAGGEARRTALGLGSVTACELRALVDFAVPWMSANRPPVASS